MGTQAQWLRQFRQDYKSASRRNPSQGEWVDLDARALKFAQQGQCPGQVARFMAGGQKNPRRAVRRDDIPDQRWLNAYVKAMRERGVKKIPDKMFVEAMALRKFAGASPEQAAEHQKPLPPRPLSPKEQAEWDYGTWETNLWDLAVQEKGSSGDSLRAARARGDLDRLFKKGLSPAKAVAELMARHERGEYPGRWNPPPAWHQRQLHKYQRELAEATPEDLGFASGRLSAERTARGFYEGGGLDRNPGRDWYGEWARWIKEYARAHPGYKINTKFGKALQGRSLREALDYYVRLGGHVSTDNIQAHGNSIWGFLLRGDTPEQAARHYRFQPRHNPLMMVMENPGPHGEIRRAVAEVLRSLGLDNPISIRKVGFSGFGYGDGYFVTVKNWVPTGGMAEQIRLSVREKTAGIKLPHPDDKIVVEFEPAQGPYVQGHLNNPRNPIGPREQKNARQLAASAVGVGLLKGIAGAAGAKVLSAVGNPRRRFAPLPPISETEIHTWFERDRAHVELRDKRTGKTIVEWRDEDVNDAVESGFLAPRRHGEWVGWHTAAYAYAKEHGMGVPLGRNPSPSWHQSAAREYAGKLRADAAAGHDAADYWQGALAAESRALAMSNPRDEWLRKFKQLWERFADTKLAHREQVEREGILRWALEDKAKGYTPREAVMHLFQNPGRSSRRRDYRRNPDYSKIKGFEPWMANHPQFVQAVNKFVEFHGCMPQSINKKDMPGLGNPGDKQFLVQMGKAMDTTYKPTHKGSSKYGSAYIHEFGEGLGRKPKNEDLPDQACTPDGKSIVTFGGKFEVKDWVRK